MNNDVAVMYEEFAMPIYKYVLRLCHDEEMANYITGDVFSKVIDQIAEGGGPQTNVRSYLYETARHCVIDDHRKHLTLAPLDVVYNVPAERNIRAIELEVEKRETILEGMRCLSENERNVIFLRFMEGYKLDEIAVEIEAEHNAVRQRCARGLHKMRKTLNGELIVRSPKPIKEKVISVPERFRQSVLAYIKETYRPSIVDIVSHCHVSFSDAGRVVSNLRSRGLIVVKSIKMYRWYEAL